MRRASPITVLAVTAVAFLVAACGSGDDDAASPRTAVDRQQNASRSCELPQAAATSTGRSEPGRRLSCLRLPRRLVPAGSTPAGWDLGGGRFVLVGDIGPRRSYGYAIWRRDGSGWRRMGGEHDLSGGGYEVAFGDVTQDGRTDVLLENSSGSGGCGDRFVLGVGQTRVTELFRRSTCEVSSRLQDGLLLFREPVGTCRTYSVHCWAGVRLTIRGWSGRRLVVNRTVLSCRRASVTPRRGCPSAPEWRSPGS